MTLHISPGSSPAPVGGAPDQAARLRMIMRATSPVPPPIPPPLARPSPPAAHALPPRPACTAFTIAIASGKGGVGKTNLAVNLGHALAQGGLGTTILDGDLGLGNADLLCGLTAGVHLGQYLDGARSIEDITLTVAPRLRLVPGASGVSRLADLTDDGRAGVLRALAWIEDRSDVVIIDCGAGIGTGVLSLVEAADLAIAITTPEPTAVADAYGLIKSVIARTGSNPQPSADRLAIELLVNQADDQKHAHAIHARLAAVCDRFMAYKLPLLGWLPADPRLPLAVRRRQPLLVSDPNAPVARSVRNLSALIAARARPGAAGKPLARQGWVARLVRSMRGE